MEKTTLAFEIGTEELPAFDLHAATEQLPGLVRDALAGARVPFDEVKVYSSPRRPVSYTHLDVYKRQGLHCSRERMKSMRSEEEEKEKSISMEKISTSFELYGKEYRLSLIHS